jgi:hypothetical protein
MASRNGDTPTGQKRRGTPSRALQPVGVLEIAEALDVRSDTVNKWRDRHGDFPEPRWFVSGFPAWNLSDVLTWARRTGRA